MKDQFVPILLNLIAAVFGAFGQYFYKLGAQKIGQVPLYKNGAIFIGIALFCVVMILFVSSFKLGGKISVVYPVYATTFVWGFLIATLFLKESYSGLQVFGLLMIFVGVSCIAIGTPSKLLPS